MMEQFIWQGVAVASIKESMHGFVGLLFKSNPYAPDSFLNPNCRNQYPTTVMYYEGSCKTSLGPFFQTDVNSLHLRSIYYHDYSIVKVVSLL